MGDPGIPYKPLILKMKVLIVYCHPEANSFNGTLKDVAINSFESMGDSVEISDLYGEGFDPVEKAEHYKERVHTDGLILFRNKGTPIKQILFLMMLKEKSNG